MAGRKAGKWKKREKGKGKETSGETKDAQEVGRGRGVNNLMALAS